MPLALIASLPPTAAPAGRPTAAPAGLTVAQAVEQALKNYPSIRVSQEQINAAAAGIQLARTAYLPHIDTLAQANRATRNHVFGLLAFAFPNPPIAKVRLAPMPTSHSC